MRFVVPWALALLALLPLLWLVRHEPPRQRMAVAGRFLWKPRPRRDSALGPKPSRHALLWLQTALLGALILALAGPRIDVAPATVALVLDVSMSMAARDGEGTRLDVARRRAVAALGDMGWATRVRLWTAGATPTLVGEASPGAGLEALLASVTPTDGVADLEAAVARAEQDRPQPERIHVVSDRTEPVRAPHVNWVPVGDAADNLAVTALVAAREPGNPDRLRLTVEVRNLGERYARANLTVAIGDQTPSRHVIEAAPKRTGSVGIGLDDAPDTGVVTARLETSDALAADNVRYAVVPPAARALIAVEGQSRFVEAALASHAGVTSVAPAEAAGLLRLAASSGTARTSVVVTRPDHPVVKGVNLDGLQVMPAADVPGREATILARAGSQPVILVDDDGRRRIVELRFDTADPGLALEPSFPLLLANVVEWLADGFRPPTSLRAGDPFRWQTGSAVLSVAPTGTDPAGRPLEVSTDGGAVVVGATSRAGVYTLDLGGERVAFVANPAVGDESDLSTAPSSVPPGDSDAATISRDRRDGVDLTPALLVLALVLVALEWRARARMAHGVRRTLAWPRVATRALAMALLLAALGGVRLWTGSAPMAVAFVIDRSDSTVAAFPAWLNAARETAAALEPADRAGLTVFGDTAVVERRVQEGRLPAGQLESAVAPSGTNIERALQAARASLPAEGDRRILLFTDGRQTSGDAGREAVRAAADGVRIDVVPAPARRPTARATRATAPATVRLGEPFDVAVVVEGAEGVTGTLQLRSAGPPRSQRVTLPASGVQRVSFTERADAAGLRTYRASFTEDVPDNIFEGAAEGEQTGVVVSVAGTPRVLYAGRQPGVVGQALGAAGFQVERVTAAALPLASALAAFDAVVLDDVDPLALRRDQQAALVQYVDLGGGLLVLGTEASLPAGSSGDAGFDALLPVDPRPRGGQRGSALALVVAFDKSGSMEERVAGTPKIEFAREAVRNLVAAMPPGDAVGIIAFDSAPMTVSTLGASRDAASLDAALREVRPAGATAIAPALARAREWLRAPSASGFDRKHVLLISDGQTYAGDLSNARQAVQAGGFVLSVVAVGAGPDREALNALAEGSGGRAYFADDVSDLPKTVARETSRVAGGRTVTIAFDALLGPHPLSRGLNGAPRLGGYVVTAARPDTDIVMRSHLDDPLLAIGRRGLGTRRGVYGRHPLAVVRRVAAMDVVLRTGGSHHALGVARRGPPGPARVDAQHGRGHRDRRGGGRRRRTPGGAARHSGVSTRAVGQRVGVGVHRAGPWTLRRDVASRSGGSVHRQRRGCQFGRCDAGHVGAWNVLRRAARARSRRSGSDPAAWHRCGHRRSCPPS